MKGVIPTPDIAKIFHPTPDINDKKCLTPDRCDTRHPSSNRMIFLGSKLDVKRSSNRLMNGWTDTCKCIIVLLRKANDYDAQNLCRNKRDKPY